MLHENKLARFLNRLMGQHGRTTSQVVGRWNGWTPNSTIVQFGDTTIVLLYTDDFVPFDERELHRLAGDGCPHID